MPGQMLPPEWAEREVIDASGQPLGRADDTYVDQRSGEPVFVLVRGGLFGNRLHFAPVAGATMEDEKIRLAFTADQVKNAPHIAADEKISAEEERAVFDHYGMSYEPEQAGVLVLRRVTIISSN